MNGLNIHCLHIFALILGHTEEYCWHGLNIPTLKYTYIYLHCYSTIHRIIADKFIKYLTFCVRQNIQSKETRLHRRTSTLWKSKHIPYTYHKTYRNQNKFKYRTRIIRITGHDNNMMTWQLQPYRNQNKYRARIIRITGHDNKSKQIPYTYYKNYRTLQ